MTYYQLVLVLVTTLQFLNVALLLIITTDIGSLGLRHSDQRPLWWQRASSARKLRTSVSQCGLGIASCAASCFFFNIREFETCTPDCCDRMRQSLRLSIPVWVVSRFCWVLGGYQKKQKKKQPAVQPAVHIGCQPLKH